MITHMRIEIVITVDHTLGRTVKILNCTSLCCSISPFGHGYIHVCASGGLTTRASGANVAADFHRLDGRDTSERRNSLCDFTASALGYR